MTSTRSVRSSVSTDRLRPFTVSDTVAITSSPKHFFVPAFAGLTDGHTAIGLATISRRSLSENAGPAARALQPDSQPDTDRVMFGFQELDQGAWISAFLAMATC